MPGFDPNAYLTEDKDPAPAAFDPHAYAADTSDQDSAPVPDPRGAHISDAQFAALHQSPTEEAKDSLDSLGTTANQVGRDIPVLGPLAVKGGHVLAAGLGAITPNALLAPDKQNKSFSELFNQLEKQDKDKQNELAKASPGTTALGGLAGGSMLPVPGAGVDGALGALARIGSIGALNAGDAALRGNDATKAGLLGGGISAAAEAVPGVGHVAGWAGKKLAQGIAGIKPEAIDRYLADPAGVNAAMPYAKDPEALKNMIDSSVAGVTGNVQKAQDAVTAAKEQLANAGASARQARNLATDSANTAYRDAKEALKNTRPPEQLAGDIMSHLDSQGQHLGELSGQAFDTLEQEGHSFDTNTLKQAIAQQKNKLMVGGVPPKVGPGATAFSALSKFENQIDAISRKAAGEGGGVELLNAAGNPIKTTQNVKIPASTVKQLIQQADSVSKAAYQTNAGAMSPEAAKSVSAMRRSFDQLVKNASPAYRAKMAELAPQVSLVSDMSDVFGSEQGALSALNAMSSPTNPKGYIAKKLLKQYDDAHNTNFTQDLDTYLNAQDVLRSPSKMDELKQGLPETQRLAAQLPEEQAHQAAQQGLEQAQQSATSEADKAAPLSRLQPGSTENLIRSLQNGKNIEGRKALEYLDQLGGTDYAKKAADAGAAKQFLRDTTNGSRKTVLGGAIGTALGSAFGVHGAAVGSGAGAVLGALSDRYGGQAVKAVLDAGISLGQLGNPKYAGALMQAAKRGRKALMVTHALLTSQDPQYAALAQDETSPVAGEDKLQTDIANFSKKYDTNPDAEQEPGIVGDSFIPNRDHEMQAKGWLMGATPGPPTLEEGVAGEAPTINYGMAPKKTITQATTGFASSPGVKVMPDNSHLSTEEIARLLKRLGG